MAKPGYATERVSSLGHDGLSTFGIGADTDRKTWQSVIRQLLALGHLQPDPEGHGGLQLTERCRPLLKGEIQVELRRDTIPLKRQRAAGSRVEVDTTAPGWQALRQWRLQTAGEQGVPPYVIFHDATLAAILEAQPRTLAELAGVSGVGQHKLEKYGHAVLEVLGALQNSPGATDCRPG